ncbi:MAG: hypothetical protein AAGB48_09610 [Planctomycetota bacterium]
MNFVENAPKGMRWTARWFAADDMYLGEAEIPRDLVIALRDTWFAPDDPMIGVYELDETEAAWFSERMAPPPGAACTQVGACTDLPSQEYAGEFIPPCGGPPGLDCIPARSKQPKYPD